MSITGTATLAWGYVEKIGGPPGTPAQAASTVMIKAAPTQPRQKNSSAQLKQLAVRCRETSRILNLHPDPHRKPGRSLMMAEPKGAGPDSPPGAERGQTPPSEGITSAPSKDLDETYNFYKQEDAVETDPDEARSVLRKIDLRLLPLLMVTYMLQYLDKSSINFASVYGLEDGTNLHGQDYSWLSSIFYIGKRASNQYLSGWDRK